MCNESTEFKQEKESERGSAIDFALTRRGMPCSSLEVAADVRDRTGTV